MAERTWDKYEAALLIDTYNDVDSGAFKRDIAIAKLSDKLRQRAINLGLSIDAKYRNVNGVSFMLSSLLFLFSDGQKKSIKIPNAVFFSVYDIYKNDKTEFNMILLKARKQCSPDFDVLSLSMREYRSIFSAYKEIHNVNYNLNNNRELLKVRYLEYCEQKIKKGQLSRLDITFLLHWFDMIDSRLKGLKVITISIFDLDDYEKFYKYKNAHNFDELMRQLVGKNNINVFAKYIDSYIEYVGTLSTEDKYNLGFTKSIAEYVQKSNTEENMKNGEVADKDIHIKEHSEQDSTVGNVASNFVETDKKCEVFNKQKNSGMIDNNTDTKLKKDDNNSTLTKYEINLKELEDAIGTGPFYEYYKETILSKHNKTTSFQTISNINFLKQAVYIHLHFKFTCASLDSLKQLQQFEEDKKIKSILRSEYPQKYLSIYRDFKEFIRAFEKWEALNKEQIVEKSEQTMDIGPEKLKNEVKEAEISLVTKTEVPLVVEEIPVSDIKLHKIDFIIYCQNIRKLQFDTISEYVQYLDVLNNILTKDGIIKYGIYYTQDLAAMIAFRKSNRFNSVLKQNFISGLSTLVGFYFDYLIEYLKQKEETGKNKEKTAGLVSVAQNEDESRIGELVNTLKSFNVSALNKMLDNNSDLNADKIKLEELITKQENGSVEIVETEQKSNNATKDSKDSTQTKTGEINDLLIATLRKTDLKYVDKRSKGGCLWVEGGPFDESKLEKLITLGAKFNFASGSISALRFRDGWWTKDIINESKSDYACNNHDVELSSLLEDNDYSVLRQALLSEGIKTIKELEQVKLWAFMNRLNLYPINKRQEIFEKVKKLLNSLKDVGQDSYTLNVDKNEYYGATPAECFLHYCEYISGCYPLKFRTLIGTLTSKGVDILKLKCDSNCLKMEHPVAYITVNMTEEMCLEGVLHVCKKCTNIIPALGIKKNVLHEKDIVKDVRLEADEDSRKTVPIEEDTDCTGETFFETDNEEIKDIQNPADNAYMKNVDIPIDDDYQENNIILTSDQKENLAKIEEIVINSDLAGTDYDTLKDNIRLTMVELRDLVKQSSKIIEIKNRLFHEEAFVEWEEGSEKLDNILKKLMQKNAGYVSSAQLYEYARSEMIVFLSDNDLNDERSVFDMAQHLFGIRGKSKRYNFFGKTHISNTDFAIKSNFDIACKYAEEQEGVITVTELVDYLNSVNINCGNLNALLKVQSEPHFFYYNDSTLIYAAKMKINEHWKESVHKALEKLFADVGDHIVLRYINDLWYSQLPALPNGLEWSPLLLQGVLRFYGGELNARTIMALEGQSIVKVHTMLVSAESPLVNFGDVVVAYILDNDIEQRTFEAEELRQMLVDAKIVQGNELMYNMPKALDKDERFSWNVNGTQVKVLI